MFDEMMRHLGASVMVVQGNWTYGDNLAIVNRLTAAGAALEGAAVKDPTGRYAAAWGYTKVQVLPQTAGTPGRYTKVHVLFRK
jgi:hypothetical protein